MDEYYNEDDDDDNDDGDDDESKGIENGQDLFKILSIDEYLALMIEIICEPTIVKSGYNNNYIEYRTKGVDILTIEEYLNLIVPFF